jgi:hypothetical protein
MAYRFFVIPARSPETAESELNSFLGSHALMGIDRRFVDDGERSYWSICVEYGTSASGGGLGHGHGETREKVDYREVLSPEDFQCFARLRVWRKKQAEEEGVKVFVVMTNVQLAAIATRRPSSLPALREIEGIGESRAAKYGTALLEEVARARKGGDDAKGGESDRKGGSLGESSDRPAESGAGKVQPR